MRKSSVRRIASLMLPLLAACAQEARAPGEFEADAVGALNEASIRGAAVAWFNVADGQRLFEIRLHPATDPARTIVLTTAPDEWPAAGTYQVTENAPTAQTFDLLFTLPDNRVIRGTRGTVDILESERGELTGRFSVDGVLIDMASPGANMPAVKLTATFRATCSEKSGETEC